MSTVLRGRTAVVIAHRLSQPPDRRPGAGDGARAVVQDGSPAELVASTGRFADLHQAWRDSLV